MNTKGSDSENETNSNISKDEDEYSEENIDIHELTSNKIEKRIDMSNNNKNKLYVILEHANLELSSMKKSNSKLISSEDTKLIKKLGKSKEDYRPDVTHHCLLSLMDSPLNKAGLLQVFIRTRNNILIEINPKCRIPRTYNRFEGLFAVLLKKYRIRAKESSEVLLKVIKNPISDHIPSDCLIVTLNEKSRLVDRDEYAKNSLKEYKHVCFLVGAISKGDVSVDYTTHDSVSISSYPLSAGVVCGKICDSYEKAYGVL